MKMFFIALCVVVWCAPATAQRRTLHHGPFIAAPGKRPPCMVWNGKVWVNYCSFGFHHVKSK
jgi:hypothetical protein